MLCPCTGLEVGTVSRQGASQREFDPVGTDNANEMELEVIPGGSAETEEQLERRIALRLQISQARRSKRTLSVRSRHAEYMREVRRTETGEEHDRRLASQGRINQRRVQCESGGGDGRLRGSRNRHVVLNGEAFKYDCAIDYSLHPFVTIGAMDIVCEHCGALKFAGETGGLCCLNGKVKLPLLAAPPEPLHSLLRGETPESRHFLCNAQRYNGCFQMTSFGAHIIEERGFNPTFKVICASQSKRSAHNSD